MPTKRPIDPRPPVFINCPFDSEYAELFRAILFVVESSGYVPICALDDDDSGRIRFSKLTTMIGVANLSIHDLSRIEVSADTMTPRFNMPFELGLYLGAQHFGGKRQKTKRALVFAAERKYWAPSISDLAGVDPVFHGNKPEACLRAVRDFLHTRPDGGVLPGETALAADCRRFRTDLPLIAKAVRQTEAEALRYKNYISFLEDFLELKPGS
ncbi:MAG: hypothetical protein GC189_09815 [Alphaproteobacteria bacterium]|nr:hypothetical protein [Alphaproteobacteria bacterium]